MRLFSGSLSDAFVLGSWWGTPSVIACPRPWHGLGNRMRSVLGARALARHVSRRFGYAWPTGRHFGARLDQLWVVTDPVVPVWWSRALSLRYPYRDETLRWLGSATEDPVWQIRTAHALQLPPGASPWVDELRSLRPVAAVAERVARFRQDHLGTEPYVGVMVRTHAVAHAVTLASSPLDWYIRRLTGIRETHPNLPVFVSADTEEAQDTLSRQVPGCVWLRDKGAYNSLPALEASVVDLYLLAGSIHILGAHYSSFPELAQQLGGDSLSLETPESPSTAFERRSFSQPVDPLTPHVRQPVTL